MVHYVDTSALTKLVVAEAEGRRQRYRLSDPKLAHALSDLCGLALAPAAGCEHEAGR